MSMIKCPECEKKISDEARKCPQCGCKIPACLSTGEKIAGGAVGAVAAGAGTAAVTSAACGITMGTVGPAVAVALAGHGIIVGGGTILALTVGAPIAMFAAGAGAAVGAFKFAKNMKRRSEKKRKMEKDSES